MRTKTLLFSGISLLAIMVSLSTQGQSVPDLDGSASRIAIQNAMILAHGPTNDHDHDHSHGDLEEAEKAALAAAQESVSRTITRSARHTKSVAPKQRFLAAIDKPDIELHHKQIANDVLMSLPAPCRNTLKNFYVRYEKPDHRGLAGKSVMILDGTVHDDEFRALFIHESGHNWDLGCLTGTAESGKSAYSDGDEVIYSDDPSLGFYQISWLTSKVQRSTARPEDFVSGYASYNIFEDFAESFAYFILQNEQFATRAQTNDALAQKYAWIRDTYFSGQIPEVAIGTSKVQNRPPWDITKLKYSWKVAQR